MTPKERKNQRINEFIFVYKKQDVIKCLNLHESMEQDNELKLKDRKWICPKCGEVHDRDLNAAINILNEGYRKNISDGTSDYERVAKIRPSYGIGNETLKERETSVPETTTSLV